MNFTAIDFETANEQRHSPCSLGITVVRNGKIVEEKYWLIKPHEMRFTPMNIMIHNIRPDDVKHELEFDALWPEILPYLNNQLVVAHNASFDMSVLRKTLDLYDLEYPKFDYLCTMIMSRNYFNYLPNAKLNTVNHHLGLEFNHHHAGSDAYACANILLKISEELQTFDLGHITAAAGVKVGRVYPGGYTSASTLGKAKTSARINAPETDIFTINQSSSHYFKGKTVVFTGGLKRYTRSQATQIIGQLGGTVGSSVTRKTNILITAAKDLHLLSSHQMSTKLKKAIELTYKGQEIEFMNEEQFLNYLK
ncbi:MAG TPA: DNA polymerase III subunit epsilon [Firmicutes bacterium]|nr:DNA polymerase III subunit epsilon [Bacillota bacterium]